ncbi:helix-turn-helix domain-containing protein [Streptomyces galilaeus]|uniref:helix-turn-helix domain-containing protein n=1 Tax=Streptomyces galilaeus TaxID=33899 RepID=UPI0038F7E876
MLRARMVDLSWSGQRVPAIAHELRCSPKTVRRWLHRFNCLGLDGLEDLGGQGRKRRITEAERSRIIGLVRQSPPGRLTVQAGGELAAVDEFGPPEWTLDALAAEARQLGIGIGRSQVRRILLAEGVRWRRTRSWTRSKDPDFEGKGRGSSSSTPARPPAPGWSPDGHRIKSEVDYGRGPEKTWVYGALRVRDGHQVIMTASSRNSVFYQQFLQKVEEANPAGDIYVVTDNLSSYNSLSTRTWLRITPGSGTSSSPSAPAGSTFRKAGDASSARPPSPASPSPDDLRSNMPPAWQHSSSTPGLGPGYGEDPHHQAGACVAGMCTSFEESSTRRGLRPPQAHPCFSQRVHCQ